MSKRIEATITCPNCSHQYAFTLYRTIWGEYPENRQLVMNDEINVAECPSCSHRTKLPVALMYTNARQHFAVWWEPEYDPQIDSDATGYKKMLGQNNYLATAPRVKDWEDFKDTIRKFESEELQAEKGEVSPEMTKHMEGFLKHLQEQNKKKQSSGCMLTLIILLSASTIILSALV